MTWLAIATTVNEAASIGQLVQSLAAWKLRTLVVDAGSTDDTAMLAERAGAIVLRMPRTPIRQAMLMGWEMALEDATTEAIVQIDAGGSHNPDDALRLLRRVQAAPRMLNADVAIGSRFLPGAIYMGRPLRREMSRLAAMACEAKTGARITDWTSGYRAFSRHALEQLIGQRYDASMHGWQIEVLKRSLDLDLKITEAPITYRAGRSSFNRHIALEALNAWRQL